MLPLIAAWVGTFLLLLTSTSKALKSPTVTGEAKTKLEQVKKQAVDLAKAEKDKECHTLVKDALKSVGIDL